MPNIPKRQRHGGCSNCGGPRTATRHRYCLTCKAAYMRRWRRTHPLTGEQRRQMNCRSYTNNLQARGVLPRGPCEECGEGDAENHHPDYGNPRVFNRLCRICHRRLHRIEQAADAARS